MDLDAARVHLVRPYVFDYIVGVLWLVPIMIVICTIDRLRQFALAIDSVAASMSNTTIPSFVVGFFLMVVGIILPYCVAIVLKMPTLWLMNRLLKIQRSWAKASAKAEQPLQDPEVNQLATSAVQRAAGSDGYVSWTLALLYLEVLQANMAAALRSARQDIDFRAAAALPIALIIGTA